MQTEPLRRLVTNKRLRASLGVLVIFVVIFWLLGYFWLPGYAKESLEAKLSGIVYRPVSIQSIEIQPLSLEIIARGLRVEKKIENEGGDNTLFSISELNINVSTASIAHLSLIVSSVLIKKPILYIVREGKNQFNISDLIEKFSGKIGNDKPMLSISNIVVEDGHFEFTDYFKNSHQKISEINFGIPFISNFENDLNTWVEPYFNAKINGSSFVLSGKVRPFSGKQEATLDLKLNNIDLMQMKEYSPVPIGINLLTGYFDSNLQLIYTQEANKKTKMVLSGNASLRELKFENKTTKEPYNINLEQLDVMLIDVDLSGQKSAKLVMELAGASLVHSGEEKPALSLPKLIVNNIYIDFLQKNIVLGMMKLHQFKASMRRKEDGQLNLVQNFMPHLVEKKIRQKKVEKKKEVGPEVYEVLPEGGSKLWTAEIESLKIVDAALNFEDLTLTKSAPVVVSSLNLDIYNIDFSGVDPLNMALQATINKHGSIETNGSLAWSPWTFNFVIDAKDIDFVSLQGWAGDHLNALLTRGKASFEGEVKADGEPLKIRLDGKSKFSNFNFFDKGSAADILRWKEIDISGIKFLSDPFRADIASIVISNFFVNVRLTPNGEINIKNIVRNENGAEERITYSIPVTESSEQMGLKVEALPVHIGKVEFKDGNIDFNDQFIKPNYRANLTDITGQISSLAPENPGELRIKGVVDKSAPFEITGELNPFGNDFFLDISAKITGIDLPIFSPYSGKYLGHVIEKGKLSAGISYDVKEGELKAENRIFLDQFALGKKIESPDALDIPLTLAIALLKNQRGEIDFNLPINGSFNDPNFNLGGVISDTFVNLLTKTVTSPFTLLSSLVGDGGELSEIDFLPGHGRMGPEIERRLQILSKALADRPGLKLEITGYADLGNDLNGLKREILDHKIMAQKLLKGAEKIESGNSSQDISIEPEEYEEFLKLIYEEEKFDTSNNERGIASSTSISEMEELILSNINAGDEELRQLAEQRGKAARDWLVEKGGISSDRVFVLEPQIESEVDGKKVGSKAKFAIK